MQALYGSMMEDKTKWWRLGGRCGRELQMAHSWSDKSIRVWKNCRMMELKSERSSVVEAGSSGQKTLADVTEEWNKRIDEMHGQQIQVYPKTCFSVGRNRSRFDLFRRKSVG